MVNSLINGVCSSLKDFSFEWGNAKIYTEDIPQKFLTPSFTVKLRSQKILPRINRRSILKCLLEIKYFPLSSVSPHEECGEVLNRVLAELELISVGTDEGVQTVRGEFSEIEMEDGVLSLKVTYDIFYKEDVSDGEIMGEYTQIFL